MQHIEEKETELYVRHFPPPVYQSQTHSLTNVKNTLEMNSALSLDGGESNYYHV